MPDIYNTQRPAAAARSHSLIAQAVESTYCKESDGHHWGKGSHAQIILLRHHGVEVFLQDCLELRVGLVQVIVDDLLEVAKGVSTSHRVHVEPSAHSDVFTLPPNLWRPAASRGQSSDWLAW